MQWIKLLYDLCVRFDYKWTEPLIHKDNDLIIFEWMYSDRRFGVYSSTKEDNCWYLKVWGPDTDRQMEEGLFKTDKVLDLYLWVNQIPIKLTLQETYDKIAPLLEKYGHLPITTEGCDCNGSVGSVEVSKYGCYLARPRSSSIKV